VEPTPRESALHDPERLAALRDTGLLDSPPDESIDRFTRLAVRLLDAPAAQLSLIDDDRQFAKSRAGEPAFTGGPASVPHEHSVCQHVVASGRELVVPDLREHPELRDHFATAAGVLAYAGVPVNLRKGTRLGVLCVISDQPPRRSSCVPSSTSAAGSRPSSPSRTTGCARSSTTAPRSSTSRTSRVATSS
jgi:GAF domain-containing protein